MVKPLVLVGFAIPAILALLLLVPLITKNEIPFSAANPNDRISIVYTRHHLSSPQDGIIEEVYPQKSEILEIRNDGKMRYFVTESGLSQSNVRGTLDPDQLKKLTAMIKETGFMAIPPESFPIKDGVHEYVKSSVKVTLNGKTVEIHWPDQKATDKFIPPIISHVEGELNNIMKQLSE